MEVENATPDSEAEVEDSWLRGVPEEPDDEEAEDEEDRRGSVDDADRLALVETVQKLQSSVESLQKQLAVMRGNAALSKQRTLQPGGLPEPPDSSTVW